MNYFCLAALESCIASLHEAMKQTRNKQYSLVELQLAYTLIDFRMAITLIPKNERSGVIDDVESLLHILSDGLKEVNNHLLEEMMDAIILIRGRDEFKQTI